MFDYIDYFIILLTTATTYKFGEEIIEKKDLKRKQKIPEMEKMKNRRQKNLKL